MDLRPSAAFLFGPESSGPGEFPRSESHPTYGGRADTEEKKADELEISKKKLGREERCRTVISGMDAPAHCRGYATPAFRDLDSEGFTLIAPLRSCQYTKGLKSRTESAISAS